MNDRIGMNATDETNEGNGMNGKIDDVAADRRRPKIIERFPRGVVTPPPSKSLSHRALICAALASLREGRAGAGDALYDGVTHLGDSDDVRATRRGMERMASILSGRATDPGDGVSAPERGRFIDCGESGSTLRFLIPLAGLDGGVWTFAGHGRLPERPLDVYRTVFEQCGGLFERRGATVRVRGPLRPGRYVLPGNVSSQFVSGLLFALPLLAGDSEIALSSPLESSGYARMTAEVMRHYGVRVEEIADARETDACGIRRIYGYRIPGNQIYERAAYAVEADCSQAAFFLVAAALGCDVRVAGLNPRSSQGDRRIVRLIGATGASVADDGTGAVCVRPPVDGLNALTADVSEIPDLVPPLAALACCCVGRTRLVNAGRLRAKESDRLHALKTELCKLGAKVAETEDTLTIEGVASLRGGPADAWGDHRIAMALAVAAVRCAEPVVLSGWDCVAKSYPDFWRDFEKERRNR
jgi:3-phosphoshikimate 1-carboxyvinyltransferase